MCRFGVLGSIEVRADGRLLSLGGVRQVALLAFFVLNRGRRVSVDELVDAVWEQEEVGESAKRIQVAVARLRRSLSALGDAVSLTTIGGGYRLDAGAEDVDAEVFANRIEEGRRAVAGGRYGAGLEILSEALALWRDRPLAEVAGMRFAQGEIARLEQLRLDAIEARIEAEIALGQYARAVGELDEMVASNPTRERFAAQLMLALYHSGRQVEALAVYQRTRERLVDELGLDPGPELRELQGRILRHDPTLGSKPTPPERGSATGVDAVASHAAPPADARVPRPPNATFGRDADVAAIVARLGEERCRLVTLTGPGGVGKTRVALEASRSAARSFADGAWFVSLADIRRPGDVPGAIRQALAIVPLAGESEDAAVVRFLALKDLLLVLDNFEHVLPAAPLISRLLEATTGLTVLATSREPLRLLAEECYPIAPLGLPDPEASSDPDRIGHVDAVALFCQRARARSPSFVLDADNAAGVADVCRRVDGLPLALELAAARCGLLSPREIADRLRVELGDLGSGPRDAPARQRTLRETIEWSHALLTGEEQTAFARFAAFVGGATVKAAEVVTASSLDTLDSLVAKSLLMRRANARASSRLHALDTTRAYAGERLAAAPDRHAVHARHYEFFMELAREHGTDQALMRADRAEHLAQLDADNGNLEAALAWALREGDARRALELCGMLGTYWMMRHRGTRVMPMIDAALQLPEAPTAVVERDDLTVEQRPTPAELREDGLQLGEAVGPSLPGLVRSVQLRGSERSWPRARWEPEPAASRDGPSRSLPSAQRRERGVPLGDVPRNDADDVVRPDERVAIPAQRDGGGLRGDHPVDGSPRPGTLSRVDDQTGRGHRAVDGGLVEHGEIRVAGLEDVVAVERRVEDGLAVREVATPARVGTHLDVGARRAAVVEVHGVEAHQPKRHLEAQSLQVRLGDLGCTFVASTEDSDGEDRLISRVPA
jgi:predicted ATPase/DNA-binding SARP family transcriptional activator